MVPDVTLWDRADPRGSSSPLINKPWHIHCAPNGCAQTLRAHDEIRFPASANLLTDLLSDQPGSSRAGIALPRAVHGFIAVSVVCTWRETWMPCNMRPISTSVNGVYIFSDQRFCSHQSSLCSFQSLASVQNEVLTVSHTHTATTLGSSAPNEIIKGLHDSR